MILSLKKKNPAPPPSPLFPFLTPCSFNLSTTTFTKKVFLGGHKSSPPTNKQNKTLTSDSIQFHTASAHNQQRYSSTTPLPHLRAFLLSNSPPSSAQLQPLKPKTISSFNFSNSPWRPNQNQILLSPNFVFAAKFRSQPSSPEFYTFSVWYHNIFRCLESNPRNLQSL
jgi:hypothetical protein